MIAVAGTLVADIPISPLPERGAVNWVDRIGIHLGGIVANTGKVLAKFGVPVAVIGRVGEDVFGQVVEQELSSWADQIFLKRDAKLPTATTAVLIHPDGERSFVASLGAGTRFGVEDIPVDQLHELGVRALELGYINNLPGIKKTRLSALLKRLRKQGWLISLDVALDAKSNWEEIRALLPLVDLFCPNEREAAAITGHTDPIQAARSLLDAGVQQAVVVKVGPQGCYLKAGSEEVYFPGHKVKVVDTTGAGDAFLAGMLAGWYKNLSWERSAKIANAAGALAVTGLGASEGVNSWNQAVRFADKA